jgi:ribosomal protein S18 acetylase RimI-like enzyme
MIQIRPLTIEDFDALTGLLGQLWPDKPVDPFAVRKMAKEGLASGHQAYICAVEEDKPVGFCSLTVKNNLWLEARSGNVDELVVDAAHRNRGVGRLLMAEIEKIARDRGCKRLDLESAAHRTVAHRFYEGLGFEKQEYSSFFFAKEIG